MKNVKEFAGGVMLRVEVSSGTKKLIDDAKRDFHAKHGEKILQEELVRQAITTGIPRWREEHGL